MKEVTIGMVYFLGENKEAWIVNHKTGTMEHIGGGTDTSPNSDKNKIYYRTVTCLMSSAILAGADG